jgi:hypothetical protein
MRLVIEPVWWTDTRPIEATRELDRMPASNHTILAAGGVGTIGRDQARPILGTLCLL